ncbi:MAG: nucleotidyl transferase AbiEii/AbiGii toxin family protein [Acidobacteriota bacterium]|nr:nucleotidyl transferase AbiEii/AbiGii toxin family protein [Acidobacteriota bacterium]
MRVLDALAGVDPPFVLTGGGALAGVHLGHRTTRDLDLFWRNRDGLGILPHIAEQRLTDRGLSVRTMQTTPAFVQMRITDGKSVVIVDLVAEPSDAIERAESHTIGEEEILVDSKRAILAEKLCALLERAEVRDLIDVEALLECGESFELAIADAPRRDSGFSPLTLAWVLRDLHVVELAASAGLTGEVAGRLDEFRKSLIETLIVPR